VVTDLTDAEVLGKEQGRGASPEPETVPGEGRGRSHGYGPYVESGSTQKRSKDWVKAWCQDKRIFKESCGHGNWRFSWRECGLWDCEPCRGRRVLEEIVPEVAAALRLAKQKRVTLKHLVLTWPGATPAAQPTPEGAKARAKHIAALWQWLRKVLGYAEWLKVAESHKSGRIHFHFLVVMRGVDVKKLRAFWKKLTGASQLRIDSAFLKCPSCWEPGLGGAERESRKIVPWPGSGRCGHCGHKLKGQDYERIVWSIALEAGKYLAKEMGRASKHKRLTRSRQWPRLDVGKPEKQFCAECDAEHSFERVGSVAGHIKAKFEAIEGAHVAFFRNGGAPCYCFSGKAGNPRFRESVTESPALALADMALGYHDGVGGGGGGCDCSCCQAH